MPLSRPNLFKKINNSLVSTNFGEGFFFKRYFMSASFFGETFVFRFCFCILFTVWELWGFEDRKLTSSTLEGEEGSGNYSTKRERERDSFFSLVVNGCSKRGCRLFFTHHRYAFISLCHACNKIIINKIISCFPLGDELHQHVPVASWAVS